MRTIRISILASAAILVLGGRRAHADTDFQPGSLVIPMDSCGQLAQTPAYCNWNAGSCTCPSRPSCAFVGSGYPTGGSVKLPFGLVYLLATNGIPVNVALSSTKVTLGDPDFSIAQPNSSSIPATVLTWSSSASNPLDGGTGSYQPHDSYIKSGTTSMSYGGGSFVVDAAYAQDALRVLSWFNRLDNTFNGVVIHMSYNVFTAPIGAVLQSRPRPVGIMSNALDDFFGETGIPNVLDQNAPCTSNSQCAGNPGSTVSGTCNTQAGYCRVDYWVQLSYTNGSSPASYSFGRTGSMPQPAGVCSATSCTQLVWDTGGGNIDRLLDVIWMDQLGDSGDWVNWAAKPYGLDDFLANGGRLFGIGSVGDQIENGTGSRRYMTAGSTYAPQDNGSSSDHGPFCPTTFTSSTTTATADASASPFPASNAVLQTGGIVYDINGGGGGVTGLHVTGSKSGENPSWDTNAESLIDGLNMGTLADNPVIGGKRSGWVIYEGAVNSWHGNASHKDAGLRIMYNTLLDFNGEPGGTVASRFTTTELSRSSLTPSPSNASSYYGGTFTWAVPANPARSGNNYWTPPIGAYPATTGHFREYTSATTGFGGNCSSGNPCSWDAAVKIAAQSSRKIGVVDLSSGAIKDWQDSSQSSDAAITWLRAQLGGQLGGIDYSTAAVIQSKQKPVNLGNSQKRPTLAYVGARDGLLHALCVTPSTQSLTSAVNGTTVYAANTCYGRARGEEVWALLPRVAHRMMPTTNPSLQDWSSVNVGGSMRVADINLTPTAAATWRTVLFFTTRSASASVRDSVSAIDISDPDPLNIGATTPTSLKLLWENDGTGSNITSGANCSHFTGGCAMGASAGATVAQVGSSFYLVATSATAAAAAGTGINTYLFDASNGKLIGFDQMLYSSATRGGLSAQPTVAPINSIVTAAIGNDVPPPPTLLNPAQGGTDDTMALVPDPSGLVRRFTMPAGNPSSIAATTNGLASITTIFSTHSKDQAYSNSTGSHTYNPTSTPLCPSVGGVSNTACEPIGASAAIIKDSATSPSFFAVVATGGADWASSDPINRANTQFHIHYLDPSGLGPTTTDGGATWTATATNGLRNVVALPSAITTPTNKVMSLRVYGQPAVSGNDLFVQATTLAQGSEVQLVQPILYPDYPSGCTGSACTKYWGRGIRVANADQAGASIDNTVFVVTGSGLSSVLVSTTGAVGSQAVTAYFMGSNRIYSVSSPLSGAANSTYSIQALSTSNFTVRAWLGLN